MSRRAEAGLTLVETLVALLLLAVALLAVAPLFVSAVQGNAVGGDIGRLGAAAVNRMEQLREAGFFDAQLVAGGSLTANVTKAVPYFDAADPRWIVRWQVEDDAASGAKTIRVRAQALRSVIGRPKQVTLVTLRGE